MNARIDERNRRALNQDTGSAIPVEVVSFDLSGEQPIVTVRPLQKTRSVGFDGEIVETEPLEIFDIPYNTPSSDDFGFFIPPKPGMRGALVNTNNEIGEIDTGSVQTVRVKDRASGIFVPTGSRPFKGNAGWAELRSKNSRIAISENAVHLQTGNTSFAVDENGFEINIAGISLIAALKQISDHIAAIEDLVHPHDGDGHGGKKNRLVDDLIAALIPNRSESGI